MKTINGISHASVSIEVLEAVCIYLGARPHDEVDLLLSRLRSEIAEFVNKSVKESTSEKAAKIVASVKPKQAKTPPTQES